MCLNFATKWHEENDDEESERALNYSKNVSLALEIENILQNHGLAGKAHYMELLHQVRIIFSQLFKKQFKKIFPYLVEKTW